MSDPLFPEIEREIARAANELPVRPRPAPSGFARQLRPRIALATGAVMGAAVVGIGLVANPASSAVTTTPTELARVVPALKAPAVTPPAALESIFDGDKVPSPDETANVALARPIRAQVPGAPRSWVVPTKTGACFALFDAYKSISISCGSTQAIRATGLAGTLRAADASGKTTKEVFQIGIGGPEAGPDGSFSVQAR